MTGYINKHTGGSVAAPSPTPDKPSTNESEQDEVSRIRGLAVLMAEAIPGNANRLTVKVENATFKGKLIGDVKVTVEIKQKDKRRDE